MEYKIKEFGSKSKYGNYKYWLAENKKGEIIGIIEVREEDKHCDIYNIDYIESEKNINILNELFNKVIEYLKCNINICYIQILDNMLDIKQIIENKDFKTMYISEKNGNETRIIRYIRDFR